MHVPLHPGLVVGDLLLINKATMLPVHLESTVPTVSSSPGVIIDYFD
jgi:hypothetical protein